MGTLLRRPKVNPTEKKRKKPKRKKPEKNKAKLEPPKPECILGKGFGYLQTLKKNESIPEGCFNCPNRDACLNPRLSTIG